MKTLNNTLQRYLNNPPSQKQDGTRNRASAQNLAMHSSLPAPATSASALPHLSKLPPNPSLIPSQEVDKQGIRTPLQYKAAILAAQRHSRALNKFKREGDKSRSHSRNEHLGVGAPGAFKRKASRSRGRVGAALKDARKDKSKGARKDYAKGKKGGDQDQMMSAPLDLHVNNCHFDQTTADPYSFGATGGVAHARKGSHMQESSLSMPESMSTQQFYLLPNQKTFHITRGPSPLNQHSQDRGILPFPERQTDESEMPIGQDAFQNTQQFDSQIAAGLSSIPESSERFLLKKQHDDDPGRNQAQNPFRTQAMAEPPFFSTANPLSTSADQDNQPVNNSSIQVEEKVNQMLSTNALPYDSSNKMSNGIDSQSLQTQQILKSTFDHETGCNHDLKYAERQRNVGHKHFKTSEQPQGRYWCEGLQAFEPYSNFNNSRQNQVLTSENSLDLNKRDNNQYQTIGHFPTSQGQSKPLREAGDLNFSSIHQPTSTTLTSVSRQYQAKFGTKVMHLAKQYNIELNPDNQHMFDERGERQSSMITSQTANLSRRCSSPQLQSNANTNQAAGYPDVAVPASQWYRQTQQQIRGTNYRTAVSSNRGKSGGQRDRDGSGSHGPPIAPRKAKRTNSKNLNSLEAQKKRSRDGSSKVLKPSMHRSKTPRKHREGRSNNQSNSVKRCLRAFVAGIEDKPSTNPNEPRHQSRQTTYETQKSQDQKTSSNNNKFRNTTKQSTIKACIAAGIKQAKLVASQERNQNQFSQDVTHDDFYPPMLEASQGPGKESKTSLMTAITIKTQGVKDVSNRKKKSSRITKKSIKERRSSASHPANHRKIGSGSLPKKFDLTGGLNSKQANKFYTLTSLSRSKNRCSSLRSKSIKRAQGQSASLHRTSKNRRAAQRSKMQDFKEADLYNREALIRKYFCIWIERFVTKLRDKQDRDTKVGRSIQYLQHPNPSTRGGLPMNGASAFSDSRMSLPTNSGYEANDQMEMRALFSNQGDYQLDQGRQVGKGIDPSRFLSQPLQQEDITQKYPSTHITHRNGSIQHFVAKRPPCSTTSRDRSENSPRSNKSKNAGKEQKKPYLANNENSLLMDQSKSSIPLSQSFFDAVVSPCSHSALQRRPHKSKGVQEFNAYGLQIGQRHAPRSNIHHAIDDMHHWNHVDDSNIHIKDLSETAQLGMVPPEHEEFVRVMDQSLLANRKGSDIKRRKSCSSKSKTSKTPRKRSKMTTSHDSSMKMRLKQGFQILTKFQRKKLSHQVKAVRRSRSPKKTSAFTNFSKTSKRISNSRSRGIKSRSPSKEHSQLKNKVRGPASRFSTINHTNATCKPQYSNTVSDYQGEQKSYMSQYCNSRFKQHPGPQMVMETPPRPLIFGPQIRTSKSQRFTDSKLFRSNNKQDAAHPALSKDSESRKGFRTLSRLQNRGNRVNKFANHPELRNEKLCQTIQPQQAVNSLENSRITKQDVRRLRMYKFFLKWMGVVHRLKQRSNSRHRKSVKRELPQFGRSQYHTAKPSLLNSNKRQDFRSPCKSNERYATTSKIEPKKRNIDPKKVKARKHRARKLKLRTLTILYQNAFRSHRLLVLRDQLEQKTRVNRINRTFETWIEALSEQMRMRARHQFLLQQKQKLVMQRVFQAWMCVMQSKKIYRERLLEVVPLRCLIRIMLQNETMPQQASIKHLPIGYQLQLCVQVYQMKYVDEELLHDSMQRFRVNFYRSVFQALKPEHLRNPAREIVGKRHQLIVQKNCWDQILQYSQVRRATRVKFKHISMLHQARVKSQMLHLWLERLSNKNTLMRKLFKASQYYRPRAIRKFFNHLKIYKEYRKAKVKRTQYSRTIYNEKIRKLAFNNLYAISLKLRDLNKKFEQAQAVSKRYQRRRIVQEWCIVTKKTTKARLLYEWNLKVRTFALQREATFLNQIMTEKKVRADQFYVNLCKRRVIWFLQNYCVEQQVEQGIKQHHKVEADKLYLRHLFLNFQAICQQKRKVRQICELLHEEYKAKRVEKCFNQFVKNVMERREKRERIFDFYMKKKATMFQHFKYAVRKQQALRNALIETLQKRNRARADTVLAKWRKLAFQKRVCKFNLQQKTYVFTVQRVLKKFRINQQLKVERRKVSMMCQQRYKQHLKQIVWNTLLERHRSKKVRNVRKANTHRRQKLLVPCFSALVSLVDLAKKGNHIKNQIDQKRLHQTLIRWVNAYYEMQRIKQVQGQYERWLRFRALQGLKVFHVERRQLESHTLIAEEHYNMQLVSKYFGLLQIQKKIVDAILEEKENKIQLARRHFLSKKFYKLARYARMNAILNQKAKMVNAQVCRKQQRKYFFHIIDLFHYKKNLKVALKFRAKKVGVRMMRQLKNNAMRNKEVRQILSEHLYGKEMARKKVVFNALKKYQQTRKVKGRKEDMALGQLGHFLQRKVFDILMVHARKRRRLAILYQEVKDRSEANLMVRCMKEMIGTFIIEPKLDAVADAYYKKKHLKKFKRNTDVLRERKQGGALTVMEVKAFRLLGHNLLRKSFTALKVAQKCNNLKRQEKLMAAQFQRRKWFALWRQAYVIRSKSNYLLPANQSQQYISNSFQTLPNYSLKNSYSGLPPKYKPQTFQQTPISESPSPYYSKSASIVTPSLPHHNRSAQLTASRYKSPNPDTSPDVPRLPLQEYSHGGNGSHLQTIEKQCKQLSERVRERLAGSRGKWTSGGGQPGRKFDSFTPMSCNSRALIPELATEEKSRIEEGYSGFGEVSYTQNYSPSRSMQKTQPRQAQLQQSSSPGKYQNISREMHDDAASDSKFLTDALAVSTFSCRPAAQLPAQGPHENYNNHDVSNDQVGDTSMKTKSSIISQSPKTFKKYLQKNNSFSRFQAK